MRALDRLASEMLFYAKYPMLARLMIQQVMQWRKKHQRVSCRLVSDERQLIAEGFVSALASEAVAADSMGGDPHNGGSRVLTVSYSNGDKVMYKPRDCGAYDFYHGFIRIINESKFQPFPLLSPKSLTKLDYGWGGIYTYGGTRRGSLFLRDSDGIGARCLPCIRFFRHAYG